jgi:hypothetical protein
MAKRSKIRIIIAVVAVGLVVAAFLVVRSQQAPARAAARSAQFSGNALIVINSQSGMTFSPAPSSLTPTLTAQQAWQAYATHAGSSVITIPSNVSAQLGLFTSPVGPADDPDIVAGATSGLTISNGEAYSSLNQLVYGYSWHSCPESAAMNVATLPPNPCTEWLFLDANTGQMIVETWQT